MDHSTPPKPQVKTQRVIIIHPRGVAEASATTVVDSNAENRDKDISTVQIATANVVITGSTVTSSSSSSSSSSTRHSIVKAIAP